MDCFGHDDQSWTHLGRQCLPTPNILEVDRLAPFPGIVRGLGDHIGDDVGAIPTLVPRLVRDEPLGCLEDYGFGNSFAIPCLVEVIRGGLPFFTNAPRKGREVLSARRDSPRGGVPPRR